MVDAVTAEIRVWGVALWLLASSFLAGFLKRWRADARRERILADVRRVSGG